MKFFLSNTRKGCINRRRLTQDLFDKKINPKGNYIYKDMDIHNLPLQPNRFLKEYEFRTQYHIMLQTTYNRDFRFVSFQFKKVCKKLDEREIILEEIAKQIDRKCSS